MKYLVLTASLLAVVVSAPISSQEENRSHVFLCRSPLLAFDFWNNLQEMRRKGVTLTPKIAAEVCEGMKAGREPQCIRVEMDTFKPIASGSDGALALTDGKTRTWFHHPDTAGWVHPDYYVYLVNLKK